MIYPRTAAISITKLEKLNGPKFKWYLGVDTRDKGAFLHGDLSWQYLTFCAGGLGMHEARRVEKGYKVGLEF